jgi:DNA transformation protein
MAVSRQLERYLTEQLEVAGAVTSRRMFGGVGLYLDGVFCGIISPDSGQLYLRVDDTNLPDYEAAGSRPFRPFKNKATVMSYYEVPEEVVEDPEELRLWARKARAAAERATKSKKSRKARKRRR